MIAWTKHWFDAVTRYGVRVRESKTAQIKTRMAELAVERAEAVDKHRTRSHIDAEMQSLRTALLKLEQGK